MSIPSADSGDDLPEDFVEELDERAADVEDGAFITFDEHNRQRDE